LPPSVATTRFHDLDAVQLDGPKGARLIVTLQGAQAVSWLTPGGRERLYLSPRARYDGSTPIRGGVPVCFPQFAGLGPLPKHGFLRTAPWRLSAQRAGDDYALVTFETSDTEATRAVWPHAFKAELTLMLEADRLDLELCIANTGSGDFTFTGGLHTYLAVTDVERVTLDGLQGHVYRDSANEDRILDEIPSTLTIRGEVDRVYRKVARPVRLTTDDTSLIIAGQGFTDVVLWNPAARKCAAMADMPPDGWRHMLCVEAAAADTPVRVAAGAEWYGRQSLVVA
jgi:glucose-6-phosphate 1-epimerase